MAEEDALEDAMYAEMQHWGDASFTPRLYPPLTSQPVHLSEFGPH